MTGSRPSVIFCESVPYRRGEQPLGIAVALTGEATSPEHVLSDALSVAHYDGLVLSQLAKIGKRGIDRKIRRGTMTRATARSSGAKPLWVIYSGLHCTEDDIAK